LNSEVPKDAAERAKWLEERAPHGKVKFTIEYDGTNYFGWQRQDEGHPSIQSTLEDAFSSHFGEKIVFVGAGRTDAGVHAVNQVAHFIAPRDVTGYNFIQIAQAILPSDIAVKKAQWVPADFHSQYSALGKTYVYKIWNREYPSALRAKRSLWIRKKLDLARLNSAAGCLIGTHDFNCYRSEGSAVSTTTRTVNSAKFLETEEYVEFWINGNGFLKQMVRNIVGTLLQIEIGSRDPESIPKLFETRDRTLAGPTVEPQGLYLEQVFYSRDLDKISRPL
jgi:tRNA pseudouridine38-40 synthase